MVRYGTWRGFFVRLIWESERSSNLSVVRILGYINSWRPVMVISGSDIIRGQAWLAGWIGLPLRCEHFFWPAGGSGTRGECQVRSIFESKDGTVWFDDSRFNQGLFYYSLRRRGKWDSWGTCRKTHIPISSNQITCLFLDDLGSSVGGAFHVWGWAKDLTPSLFSIYPWDTRKKRNWSLFFISQPFMEDSDLNLWVATSRD